MPVAVDFAGTGRVKWISTLPTNRPGGIGARTGAEDAVVVGETRDKRSNIVSTRGIIRKSAIEKFSKVLLRFSEGLGYFFSVIFLRNL